jgi:UDP-N-acetyl-D-glucosamine/UDP-N-acetyl-D-galactosamine dehydrogenase
LGKYNDIFEYDKDIDPTLLDEYCKEADFVHEYGIGLVDIKEVKDADCLVLAVAHDAFMQMSWNEIDSLYGDFENRSKVLIDVKSILSKNEIEKKGYSYWRL